MSNKTNTQIRYENELHNVKIVLFVMTLIAVVVIYSIVVVVNFPELTKAPWHFRFFMAVPALGLCFIAVYVAFTEIR